MLENVPKRLLRMFRFFIVERDIQEGMFIVAIDIRCLLQKAKTRSSTRVEGWTVSIYRAEPIIFKVLNSVKVYYPFSLAWENRASEQTPATVKNCMKARGENARKFREVKRVSESQ